METGLLALASPVLREIASMCPRPLASLAPLLVACRRLRADVELLPLMRLLRALAGGGAAAADLLEAKQWEHKFNTAGGKASSPPGCPGWRGPGWRPVKALRAKPLASHGETEGLGGDQMLHTEVALTVSLQELGDCSLGVFFRRVEAETGGYGGVDGDDVLQVWLEGDHGSDPAVREAARRLGMELQPGSPRSKVLTVYLFEHHQNEQRAALDAGWFERLAGLLSLPTDVPPSWWMSRPPAGAWPGMAWLGAEGPAEFHLWERYMDGERIASEPQPLVPHTTFEPHRLLKPSQRRTPGFEFLQSEAGARLLAEVAEAHPASLDEVCHELRCRAVERRHRKTRPALLAACQSLGIATADMPPVRLFEWREFALRSRRSTCRVFELEVGFQCKGVDIFLLLESDSGFVATVRAALSPYGREISHRSGHDMDILFDSRTEGEDGGEEEEARRREQRQRREELASSCSVDAQQLVSFLLAWVLQVAPGHGSTARDIVREFRRYSDGENGSIFDALGPAG